MQTARTCSSWRVVGLALVLVAGNAASHAATAQQVTPQDHMPTSRTPSQQLRALLDEHVAWLDANDPLGASLRGNDAYADKLSDQSPEAHARRRVELADRLARLRSIAPASLTASERLDYELFEYDAQLSLDGGAFFPEQLQLDSLSGPHIWLPQMADRVPLNTQRQREGYVARLEALPLHLSQITQQLRAGIAAGRVPPRVVLSKTLASIRVLSNADVKETPQISPFFKPFAGKPVEGDPLAERALRAIRDGVTPAFEAFGNFVETEYLPACRESVGASDGVDGIAFYNFCLRDHTTTTMTADEIHALGLREVASLRSEMLSTIRETDFVPPAGATDDQVLSLFLAHTRDPRFLWSSADAMMADYRELCKRIDPELPRLFRTLPRNTYGVREIPAFAARTSPVAYYYPGSAKAGVPGYFMVNTSNLALRPRFARVSLTIHEAVPGHHFQVALAQELADEGLQHPFRTRLGFTAFVEGWGLYSERLGLEMGERRGSALRPTDANRGLYQDPYDNFGRLSDEMWRACRLVVDTGLHAKGWTRQQAIDYLLANTAISELDARSETDRYIGWPGQACAYKIGQLEILDMRAKAEATLGDRFDIRGFHDTLLLQGAVPLPVLRRVVEGWVASQSATPQPAQ